MTPTAPRSSRWIVVALVAAAVIPFLPSLTYEFVLDDRWIVRGNEAIRGWSSLITLWGKPYWATETVGEAGLYRPLFMVILATLWNAGLQFPIFFHLMAVAAHATTTVLVWRVLRAAVPANAAVVGALVFATHPVHAEAVANVTNSSEVFAAIWTLLLVLVVLGVREHGEGDGRIGWRLAVVTGALAGAAMLTKESGVVAPALAALVVWGWRSPASDNAPERVEVASVWRTWSRVIVAWGIAFAIVVIARLAVLGSPVSRGGIAAEGLESLTFLQRDAAMLALGPGVVRLLLWPGEYNPMIGARVVGVLAPGPLVAVGSVAAAIVIALVAWRFAARGDRRPAVALAWIAIASFPASNLLVATGQILSERTLYLASIGVAMLAVLAASALAERLARLPQSTLRVTRIGAVAAMVLIMVITIDSTAERSLAWRNHETLFTQGIAADPGDYRAHWRLASYRYRSGNVDGSIEPYQRAYELNNGQRVLCQEFVAALTKAGRPAEVVRAQCQRLP